MTIDTAKIAELQDRVLKFQMLELPGQPRGMHMGTSYLVSDLSKTIIDLIDELEKVRARYGALDRTSEAELAACEKERDAASALLLEAAIFIENAAKSEQFRIDYKDHYGDHEGIAIDLLARIQAELGEKA